MKKIVGLLCLLVGLGVLAYSKTRSAADEVSARLYMRQAAEARDREAEISRVRNKLAMEAPAMGDAIVKYADTVALEDPA
jgi:hypothetical protein